MKKSLLTLAISATVAVPMVAFAESHAKEAEMAEWDQMDHHSAVHAKEGHKTSVYGSIRPQLVFNGGDADVGDGGSRFGVKGTKSLGNGNDAFYKLEIKANTDKAIFGQAQSADTDDEGNVTGVSTSDTGGRLGYAGISGAFGAIALGQQWNPYYNEVVSPSDVFASNGLPFTPSPFRTSDAITYALPGGMPVSGQIMLQVDGGSEDDDDVDRISAGFTFGAGPVSVALGYDKPQSADDALVGLTVGGHFGGAGVRLLVEDDGDNSPWALTATYSGFALQYSEDDADDDAVTAQYTHKMGAKTRIQISAQDRDSADDTKVVVRLRTDF